MIILITGASHTGKTLLAQKLLEKLQYPYLSMDHVKMGLIRAGLVDADPCDPDEAVTAAVWPVVREMIKTAVENAQDLIVEGCYVPADWKREFAPEYLENVRLICLVMTEDYIRTHFEDILRNASVIEKRITDGDFDLPTALKDNERYFSLFKENADRLLVIQNDYETDVNRFLNQFERERIKMLFVCYPRCTTCQRAQKWLDSHGVAYEFRNIKEANPTEAELREWHARSGLTLKRFFNTSGLQYKALNLKDRLPSMSEDAQLELLASDGMLVKRPILISDKFVLVGFKEEEYKECCGIEEA